MDINTERKQRTSGKLQKFPTNQNYTFVIKQYNVIFHTIFVNISEIFQFFIL